MKLITRILLLAALAGLGYWLWTTLVPRDESVVRKRVHRIATLMTFDSKEGNFARLAKVEEVANLFAMDVEIVINTERDSEQILTGRTDLRQRAFAMRTAVSSMTVTFLDSNVTLSPDKSEAVVNLTGEVRVAGNRELHVQELRFQLRKIDGEWLVVRVEKVRTLN